MSWANRGAMVEYIAAEEPPSSQIFWEAYWSKRDVSTYLKVLDGSALWRIVTDYMHPHSTILDMGCGLCPWVILLERLGHHIVGIDHILDPLKKGRVAAGPLELAVADLEELPFPDTTFDVCLCIGALEHLEYGLVQALAETRRVLGPEGVLISAVPFLNVVERRRLCRMQQHQSGLPKFHQYVFTKSQWQEVLISAGFAIDRFWYFDCARGLQGAFNLLPDRLKLSKTEHGLPRTFKFLRAGTRVLANLLPATWCAHMMLAIAHVNH